MCQLSLAMLNYLKQKLAPFLKYLEKQVAITMAVRATWNADIGQWNTDIRQCKMNIGQWKTDIGQ